MEDGTEAPRVLLVDDIQAVQVMYGSYLESKGYRVSLAGNGQTALKHLKSNLFDVVVLDQRMPDMSGLEIAGCVKMVYDRLAQAKSIPPPVVLLFTAYQDDARESEKRDVGITKVVTKPIPVEQLEREIWKALEERGSRRPAEANVG